MEGGSDWHNKGGGEPRGRNAAPRTASGTSPSDHHNSTSPSEDCQGIVLNIELTVSYVSGKICFCSFQLTDA